MSKNLQSTTDQNVDELDQFTEKLTKIVLISGLFATFFATLIHQLETDPHILNLIVPPVAFVGFIMAYLVLKLRWFAVKTVLFSSFIGAVICMATPIWYFSYVTHSDPALRLIDQLPPVLPLVIPMVIALILIIRPKQILKATVFTWLMFSFPVALYLVLNPAEIFEPRGMDFIVLLGPVCLVTFTLIPLVSQAKRTLSDMRQSQNEMRKLSEIDGLTGCLNRRAGESVLRQIAKRHNNNAGAILFDIDNFKNINDVFGHATGDIVLCSIVDCCNNILKSENQLIRWGGEEFLLIVENVNLSALEAIAQRLKTAIYSLQIENIERISASFGVSVISPFDTVDTLFDRIDKAMYMAKDKGRNQIVSLEAIA